MKSPMQPQIPTDPDEQRRRARAFARAERIPAAVARLFTLDPQKRVAAVYPEGIVRGAAHALRMIKLNGRRVPERIGEDWIRGIAAAAALPPTSLFAGRRRADIGAAIYRAGVERGVLLTLEALGLRPRGGG